MSTPEFPIDVGDGVWLDRFTFRDHEGALWRTLGGAKRRRRLPPHVVHSAKQRECRLLRGRTIDHQEVTPPFPVPFGKDEVTVYSDEDLKTMRDRRNSNEPPEDKLGRWLTRGEIKDQYDVAEDFVSYWNKRESRLRPGEMALRKREFWNERRGAPGLKVNRYLENDVDAILAGKEDLGRFNRVEGQLDREAAESVKAILRKRGPMSLDKLLKLAQQRNVTRQRFYKIRRANLLKLSRKWMGGHGERLYGLPGQEFPKTRDEEAAETMEKILRDTGEPLQVDDFKQAARDRGVSRKRFYRVLKKKITKITRRKIGACSYYRLPGQAIPDTPRQTAVKILEQILAERGPTYAAELKRLAREKGVSRNRFYEALGSKQTKFVRKRSRYDVCYGLRGQKFPDSPVDRERGRRPSTTDHAEAQPNEKREAPRDRPPGNEETPPLDSEVRRALAANGIDPEKADELETLESKRNVVMALWADKDGMSMATIRDRWRQLDWRPKLSIPNKPGGKKSARNHVWQNVKRGREKLSQLQKNPDL